MSESEQRAEQALQSLDALSRVPPLGGPVGRVVGWLDRLVGFCSVMLLLAIAAMVIVQILGRLVLPAAPVWTEEASRYLFIAMIACASGLVMRRGKHISLELFQHWLGVRGACLYQLLVTLTLAAFALLMLPYAWQFAAIGTFQTSATMKIPMIWVYATMALLLALTALYGAIGAIEAVMGLVRGDRRESRRSV